MTMTVHGSIIGWLLLLLIPFIVQPYWSVALDPHCAASDDATTCHEPRPRTTTTRLGSYELLAEVPHDATSFTQGLELYNETHVYESAGLYGESKIRLVELQTGQVVHETKLDQAYFAEGLTRCQRQTIPKKKLDQQDGDDDFLIVLTWKERIAFRLHPHTLKILSNFSYSNPQGWGIACHLDDDRLYMTDGTTELYTWNATTMQPLKKNQQTITYQLAHHTEPKPLPHVNELELDTNNNYNHHKPTLLGNVWYQDVLVRIEPETAFVNTIYDLTTLRPPDMRGTKEDCLNGIAYVSDQVVWVSGKLWPTMYKIRLIEPDDTEETKE